MQNPARPWASWLPRGHLARRVMVLAGGTAMGQGLLLAAAPILTRLYAPEAFGVLAAYGAVLSIAVVAVSLRYELAIPLPEDDQAAVDLLGLSMGVTVIMSCLAALAVWAAGGALAQAIAMPQLAGYMWLLPLGLLAAGTYQVLSSWMLRDQAFKALSRTRLSQSAGQVLVQIGAGLAGAGPWGLLAGDVVGRGCGSGALARAIAGKHTGLVGRMRPAGLWRAACRYRRFPLLSAPSSLLNSAVLHLPSLLLGLFYGPAVLGWYMLCQRVFALPIGLLGHAVGQVYYAEASEVAQVRPEALPALFRRSATRLARLGVAPIVMIGLAGPWVFGWIFGESWRSAGVYLLIMVPMIATQMVASPLGGTLSVLERQELHVAREAARLAVMVGALVAARTLGADATMAIALLSAAGTLGYLIHLAASWHALRRPHVATAPPIDD